MIRISFLIIAIISLIYGSIFLITPSLFVNLSEAEYTNVAWLRNIGASIVGLLFIGCMNIFINPNKKISLLKIITVTSILQTTALIYSRIYNEFSAKNIIMIDLSIYLAIFVSIYFALILIYKSDYFL